MKEKMSLRNKQYISYVLTFLAYALLINWKIAILLMVAVGFHESSHLWAAKKLGLATKGFFLIPFMGGAALIAERYKYYTQQVFVVLMGPFGGGFLAGLCALAYYFTGVPWLAAAAQWMLLMNLFNLLPLSFLDGGQVMEAVTYSINDTLGMVCMAISTLIAAVLLFKLNFVLFILVMFFGTSQVINAYKNWKNKREGKTWLLTEDYLHRPAALTKKQMAVTVGAYLLLIGVMGTIFIFINDVPGASISYFLPKKAP